MIGKLIISLFDVIDSTNSEQVQAMVISLTRIMRHEILCDGLNREEGRRLIEACRTHLADLLPRVDTLSF